MRIHLHKFIFRFSWFVFCFGGFFFPQASGFFAYLEQVTALFCGSVLAETKSTLIQ